MKKIFSFIAITLFLAASCENDRMRLQVPEELGTDKDDYMVEAEGGVAHVMVYTNMPGSARLIDGTQWAELSATEFSQDITLEISVAENKSSKRKATMVLETQSRRDTVSILQKGVYEEVFVLGATSVVAYNGLPGGKTKVNVTSNIPPSAISFRKVYLDTDAADWISGIAIEDNDLVITAVDNKDEKRVRRAAIDIRYSDGWGNEAVTNLMVTQANSQNRIGNQITFEELRNLAKDTPVVLDDDYTIEGYVVSDNLSGNAGDNIQSTSTTIDSTICHKTAYLQSIDGKYGVMMEFATIDDYILENNSRSVISLEGVTLHREGTSDPSDNEPLRYYLTGLVASKVVSCQQVASSEIPVKEKQMKDLTDDDLFTRVTLTDCEFPVRKGSLTPVNEGYTSLFNSHRVTKFPTLIRDIDGSSMYIYTNMTCRWRRDGSRMGYGSGSVTGVLVHEKYRRFIDKDASDENLCGNIGKYQLRPMSRDDFHFADSFADSFSEMICEWRYLLQGNSDDNGWNATYGKGTMNHSYSVDVNKLFETHAYPVYSFSYLGNCGKAFTTNENGFGIILEDGTDYGKDYIFDPSKGNLAVNNTLSLGWMASNWWNASLKIPEYWFIHFSTKEISTNHLSMQLSALNASQEGKSPVKWRLQWATECTPTATWTDIATYSVPDVVLYTVTQPWQSAGFKPMDFELPLDMLGKDDVYLRMVPDGQKGNGNTTQGYLDTDYANGAAGSTSKANNAIDYIAIRYNK